MFTTVVHKYVSTLSICVSRIHLSIVYCNSTTLAMIRELSEILLLWSAWKQMMSSTEFPTRYAASVRNIKQQQQQQEQMQSVE